MATKQARANCSAWPTPGQARGCTCQSLAINPPLDGSAKVRAVISAHRRIDILDLENFQSNAMQKAMQKAMLKYNTTTVIMTYFKEPN